MKLSTTAGIKMSTRARLKLTDEEKLKLKTYLAEEPAAFKTVGLNTGLSYSTIRTANINGYGQLRTVIALRDFLKKINPAA